MGTNAGFSSYQWFLFKKDVDSCSGSYFLVWLWLRLPVQFMKLVKYYNHQFLQNNSLICVIPPSSIYAKAQVHKQKNEILQYLSVEIPHFFSIFHQNPPIYDTDIPKYNKTNKDICRKISKRLIIMLVLRGRMYWGKLSLKRFLQRQL
ncbi:hypothetical protein [Bacillus sp. ISL-7]|uniref:hypothetical protein n=1 Tax=Bacillus sp. ISL-7 TaxID=2819136 RepID=UPI001BE98BD1|nr:hypothetical protein [Bacillus sp. ISL-7]MBT2733641.1 hypothetical protein [Bacillus sp. ISL-7]